MPSRTIKKCIVCKRRAGKGTPPVCNQCFSDGMYDKAEEQSSLDELFEKLADNPSVRHLMDKATQIINAKINQVVDRAMNPQRPTAPPTPKKENPRDVLLFGPEEKLTREIIKTRHRDLVKLIHPDKGGSTVATQRLNVAAKELLDSVEETSD